MGLVKDYGLSTTNAYNFSVTFAIPNNCDYVLTSNAGKYYVTVSLNKGQTVPSSVFVPCTVSVTAISDITDVQFQQILNGITTTKPKMKVDNC